MNDPWWLSVIKIVVVFVGLLTWTIFNVWFERRVLGKMQNRLGPVMNGPLGLGQAMGDGVKLLFKEDFRPAKTDGVVFNLAPYLTAVAAFTMWTVIPLGGDVRIFGHATRLQIADFPVSVIFVMAMAGLGVYGLVLAGWSSSGTYSLFGSMRATAQLISYEIAMGLAIVAVAMYAGSLSMNDVVGAQALTMHFGHMAIPLPGWYGLILLPSFITYVISMFGETNRLPFDLAECESELLSGHITDYSGFRYAIYFLAEYINVATVSAVATTLFLGGYRAPWPFNQLWGGALDHGWFTIIWFLIKVQILIFIVVWARAALPRFRYDHFMSLGWKVLIPANLGWILLVAIYHKALAGDVPMYWLIGTAVLVAGVIVVAVWLAERQSAAETVHGRTQTGAGQAFDPYAGGYPVPPKPGTQLPELAGLVPATIGLEGQQGARRLAADDEEVA